ncbi:MAG: hypothetical protein ABW170_15915 [Candidatus Thiodiazotropha sp. L084R]
MVDYPHLRAKNDPLSGFFRWGRQLFPVINNHACIIEERVDPLRLELAFRRTLERFEHLYDLISSDDKVRQRLFSDESIVITESKHSINFDSAEMRETLLSRIAGDDVADTGWPVRLHLILSSDGKQSCLHLGIAHDVADIKSGNIFLLELIQEYTRQVIKNIHGSEAVGKHTIHYEHLPLERLKPGWYNVKRKIVRWAISNRVIAWRMLTRIRTRVCFSTSDKSQYNQISKTDFRHVVLPKQLADDLSAAARYYKVTINTIFSAALVRYIGCYQHKHQSHAVYTIAVSLRKLLGSAFADTFRSYMIDTTLRIPHSLENRALFSKIEEQTASARQDMLEIEMGRMESAITLFKSPLPRAIILWIMKRTQGTNIIYSNPGIVEENLSHFGTESSAISSIAIFGCLVPPYDLMFHTPMINGKLQLDIVYRRSCFNNIEEQFIQPFIHEMERLLIDVPKGYGKS